MYIEVNGSAENIYGERRHGMARRSKHDASATRNALLDAAEALFEAEGVPAATLERIAAGAELTRGAVYWHFKDKEDILNAIVARADFPLDDLRSAGVRAETGDALDELRQCAEACILRLGDDERYRRVCRILMHGCVRLDGQNPIVEEEQRVRDEANVAVEAMFRTAERQDRLAPGLTPASLTWAFSALMRGLYSEALLAPEGRDLRADVRAAFDAFFEGARRR